MTTLTTPPLLCLTENELLAGISVIQKRFGDCHNIPDALDQQQLVAEILSAAQHARGNAGVVEVIP